MVIAPQQRPIMVDTNVISFLYREDTRAVEYERLISASTPHLSVVSVGELLFGAARANWSGSRTSALMAITQAYIVVEITYRIAETWAQIRAQTSAIGRTLSQSDAWIAASALVMECPLITHNPSDFSSIHNLELITFVGS